VNRRVQAKLAKSKNVHIIKTTAPIPTKFCTGIKTIKCPSWVVPTHTLQIQDGGRPPSWEKFEISKIPDGGGRHFEKSKNSHFSAAVGPILTKFGKMMQFDPP